MKKTAKILSLALAAAMTLSAFAGCGNGNGGSNASSGTESKGTSSACLLYTSGDTGMLSSEYFPNRKLAVSEELARDLRDYYDFFTAYETVLRHPEDRRE